MTKDAALQALRSSISPEQDAPAVVHRRMSDDQSTEEMRIPWSREPCWECGADILACLGTPTPKSKPVYCDGCEALRNELYIADVALSGDWVLIKAEKHQQLVDEVKRLRARAPVKEGDPELGEAAPKGEQLELVTGDASC